MTDREPDDPLGPKLRRWFADHEAPAAPASLRRFLADLPTDHPATERLRPTETSRGARAARPGSAAIRTVRLLAIAAALAILAVAGGLLLAGGRRPAVSSPTPTATTGLAVGSPTPTSSPPASSPSPSASALPVLPGFTTPTPAPDGVSWTGLRWTKLHPQDSLGLVRQVIPWSGGYLALGLTTVVAGETVTPLWRSDDGQHWITVPPASLGQQPFILAIGRAGPSLVALTSGEDDRNCGPDASSEALCMEPAGTVSSWTSSDGAVWTQHAGPPGPPDEVTTNVASGPSGMVFVDRGRSGGSDTKSATPAPDSSMVAVSADGTSWRVVATSELPAGVQMNAVVGTSSGYLAVGGRTTSSEHEEAVALWSADGEHWQTTPLTLPTAGAGGIIEAATGPTWSASTIVMGGQGFIVQGLLATVPGAEFWWQSFDGRVWQPLRGYPPLGPTTCEGEGCGGGPDGALVGDGTRMITFRGVVPFGERAVTPGAWLSSDGLHWRSLSMAGAIPQVPPSVLPFGLVAGLGGASGGRQAWFGQALTAADPALPPP